MYQAKNKPNFFRTHIDYIPVSIIKAPVGVIFLPYCAKDSQDEPKIYV
ncbi:MAG: hypothetical protein UW01_C0012G0004 [Candidatus Nomurabacteria bacterium GW2011_GWA2_43_66]|uniref:Uncharacterized protein n=1 Tax=Candidatus Nomurabacteria bacterium GW2011_GWF2_43_24 TaxID=1618778 RepID=A0A0G1HI47_9BACT|nr:MAG: hypothetical protein UV13_C0014G0004 [Parcubacteria group bacterium GW2011_GWC1_42_21]KKS58193.1 MAG: hypothetical protein UV23_C0014G0004 [Candidatus Nomurabacteria bacterium GW2011_GWF1_42_40]KKS99308.1 MAG: hypothetical protein UV77_C0015G0010 [Candidatus Nomurabacteria bacterium GW2011_GWA1_43_17]KKT07006.1 MAG: hypothetical protein UV85_C0013G0004 [Candidatus Nomurabacteria bacterium GW2011_GWB1_43_19]KKT10519.1 MAG: hypothetical protein UV91_C0013G0004 [Candidatus Nomurabacteria b